MPGKATERRSWGLRCLVPRLVTDVKTERWSVVRMGTNSVERELQRTGREREVGEKPHPPGQKPEGGRGRRPLGLGGARPTTTGVGRKKHRTTTGEKEGRRPGLGILRTQEAGEGSLARSS